MTTTRSQAKVYTGRRRNWLLRNTSKPACGCLRATSGTFFKGSPVSYQRLFSGVTETMITCGSLERLPVELRLRVYEELLRFNDPIKLRQVVPGSRNLSILRTNRYVYHEALPVLYDSNTITVTRNDFCEYTEARLRTPLRFDYTRHLLITSFSQSIACTLSGPGLRCAVCQPSAEGLIRIFTQMPRLQTVLIDYHNHLSEMRTLRESVEWEGRYEFVSMPYAYKLRGPGIEGLDIQLRCGRQGG